MSPPSKAEWIATLRCNLRCAHCLAGAGRKAAGELDTRESLKLLGELAELGVRDLCISGGEFTLRPDWEELLACALARFPRTTVITNGFLGRRLVDAAAALRGGELSITVSLDGGRQAHDARRGAGSFDKAVEVLGARTRRRMSVLTAVDRSNLGELERIAEINRSLGVQEWFIQPCLPLGRMAPEGFVGEAGLKTIAGFVRLAQQRFGFKVELGPNCWFGYFHPIRQGRPWRGCPAGVDQLVVMPAGELLACTLVPAWTFGNVRSRALRDARYSPELDAVRRSRPSGCASCSRCPRGCEVMQRLFGRHFCAIA
ncbi:MAG: radical SAM protein [Elusimicrobia bacterium]|nr:radical SAM protein [Elusimicrobiota bacterium]